MEKKDERVRRLVGRRVGLPADHELLGRFVAVTSFSNTIRSSEYHVTNACNIRCRGCWFFEHAFDTSTREVKDLAQWRSFVQREAERGVNAALLIGGEPTLFLDRIRLFVEHMRYVTISSNGLQPLPWEGFERVNVALSLFGGGELDDDLRGHRPSGARFSGIFETALKHYRNDPRAIFIYALAPHGSHHVADTVRRIRDNGNRVTFNYYSQHGGSDPLQSQQAQGLLETALEVRESYSDTVLSTPYFIQTLISGQSDLGTFGYDVCPSISASHPQHDERRKNGQPTLPKFNVFAPDLETVLFCCTSGDCGSCRDSQAVYSWLLSGVSHFLKSPESLQIWVELAESYWRQFVWSPYHTSELRRPASARLPIAVEGAAPALTKCG